jgi:hypothetical protein
MNGMTVILTDFKTDQYKPNLIELKISYGYMWEFCDVYEYETPLEEHHADLNSMIEKLFRSLISKLEKYNVDHPSKKIKTEKDAMETNTPFNELQYQELDRIVRGHKEQLKREIADLDGFTDKQKRDAYLYVVTELKYSRF